MAKIMGAALLLFILLDTFYDGTALHAGIYVTKGHIQKCGCRVFPSGTIKCRSPLFPAKVSVKKQDLIKCFCSRKNQHKFPEFQAACSTWYPGFPITLL